MFAAFLHASWNFILRGAEDKLLSMTSVVLGHVPFAIIGILAFGLPDIVGLKYILASSLLHFFYQVFLLNAYRFGELSEIYPTARGLSPLIIVTTSYLFFYEEISINQVTGIFLISFTLIIYGSKQFLNKQSDIRGFLLAIITGCFIASYSLVDGYGARITQNPIGFYSVMTLINGLIFYFFARWKENNILKRIVLNGKTSFFIGGTASYLAYGIVVWGCLYLPIAVVSSLRETSILFAVILGIFFLKEKISITKYFLIAGLFLGVMILKFG